VDGKCATDLESLRSLSPEPLREEISTALDAEISTSMTLA